MVKLNIKTLLANKGNYGAKRATSSIKYIVIHYTGNDGDKAVNNAKYFQTSGRGASAHYFVDDNEIYQSVPDNYVAWSVGGSKYNNGGGKLYGVAKNANTLNIEMCDTNKDGKSNVSEKTLQNVIALVKQKMQQYNIPISHVIRHYDVTGKLCPAYYVNESAWTGFKARITGSTTSSTTQSTPSSSTASTNTNNQTASTTSSNKLTVDGKWGVATTKRLQQIFGTTTDGKISNQWKCYESKNPGLQSTTFEWHTKPNGKGSQLIKAMQKWAGMSSGNCDGEIGTNTIKAFQKKLGTTQDGIVSSPSNMVKALQKWCNTK